MEPASADAPSPGDVIAQYTVESLLGQGGMAVVYKVVHNTLGSHHALKLLTVQGRTISQRLVREGRVQASLRHPNIVAVTDYVEHHGRPGLVMEYVDGPSLQGWLEQHGRPDPTTAERWFRLIVSAVGHAHEAGLVHRDLKPGNVLLQPVGRELVPKVADFGIAKVLVDDQPSGGAVMTRTGLPMGSPAYMAPEQIRSAKDVDARADVFSLGCILYELATGRRAFPGDDIVELFATVASGSFADPLDHAPELDPRLRTVIRGCLRANRDARLPSCAAVLELLDGRTPAGFGATPAPVLRALDAPIPGPSLPVQGGDTATFAPDDLSSGEPTPALAPTSPRRLRGAVAVLLAGGLLLGAGALLGLVLVLGWWLTSGGAPTVVPEPVPVEGVPAPVAPVPEAPVPAPEPAPVAVPTPVTAPAPPPQQRPAPAPKPALQVTGTWRGSAGTGTMTLELTSQQGARLSGRATVPGASLAVSGSVGADGKNVHLQEVGGEAVFQGHVDESAGHRTLNGTWRRDPAGQEYQMFLVQQ